MTHTIFRLKPMLILLFWMIVLSSQGQMPAMRYGETRVKVYRTKDDSLRSLMVGKIIAEEMKRRPLRQPKIDSLIDLQWKIESEGAFFKTIYLPGKGFILTDSLNNATDFSHIKKVCVYQKKEVPDVLWKCKNLEALELINTSLKKLPPELNTLHELKTINIYSNRSARPLRLTKNQFVTSLTIRNETPKGLPRSFKKFSALTKLNLTENSLIKFPNGSRHNKMLIELSLQRNALTLRRKIKKHPYLERLSLQNNEIEYVPSSIKNCSNLKKLNFNSNKIKRVSHAIGELQKLEQLSFYNNQLSAIPAGIYKISSLKEIDLFHNQIDRLDARFSNWQNLQVLYLSHNKLVELPENIDTLKSLGGIYLWDNRLGKLPESIGNLHELKYLRVNNNYLKNLPSSILQLENLEEIDISHNYISEVPEEIFNYRNLRIIAMTDNPWNEKTLVFLKHKAEELRAKDVFVHISDEEK